MIATLHDDVVEPRGSQARQRRHLRARLDLEHANRVGVLQHAIHDRIVWRQVRQIQGVKGWGLGVRGQCLTRTGDFPSSQPQTLNPQPPVVDYFKRILQYRHHAES